MGIISEFQELNHMIEEDKLSSPFHIISKIRYNIRKKKLIKIIDKLRIANTPLSKDDLIEFAGSIYSNCIPSGEYKNIKVSYYSTSNSYRMIINLNEDYNKNIIRSSTINMSSQGKNIELSVTTENPENGVTASINVTSKEFYTNVKEIKGEVMLINSILINLMADFILDNIKY